MSTIAEQVSQELHDDGQCFSTDSGEHFTDLINRLDPTHERHQQYQGADPTRYTFSDGSVITEQLGAWDLGYADCYCWQGAGHYCERADD